MGFTLPPFEGQIDCAPLGYPGMAFDLLLNPPYAGEYEAPKQKKGQPPPPEWTDGYWYGMGRLFLRVHIPEQYRNDDQEVVELGSGKAVYDLAHTKGFDPRVVPWVFGEFVNRRTELTEAAVKNLSGGSGDGA